MKLFGLTGGVGMGKSTTDRFLRERGVAVVDTDVLARTVVEPGQPALEEIQSTFGAGVIGPHGHLDRDALARIVFRDESARRKLEAIVHPRIRALWMDQVARWRSEDLPVAVVVIPLLFETGASGEFDSTVCVACTAVTQRARLGSRGWSPEQIEQRIEAQWPVEKKLVASDFVIWTEGTMDVHAGQVERIFFPT